VYDALTRERHYRQPMPIAEVLAHLEEGRDSRFDPEVLNGFRRYFDQVLAKREDALERKRSRLAGVSEGGLTTAGFGPASEEPDTLFHTEDDDSDVETDRSSAPDTGAGFSSDLV